MTRAQDVVADLRSLTTRRAALDRVEASLLSTARGLGVSWVELADALSLGSRQAAEQRYRRLLDRLSAVRDESPTGAEAELDAGISEGDAKRRPGDVERFRIVIAPAEFHPTRRRLIRAAATALTERGYASTRLSDIAAHAGLRAGSVYYHYRSKDALIEEVLRFGVAIANQAVVTAVGALPPHATALERLRVAIGAHLQAMLRLDSIARAHVVSYGHLPPQLKERIRPVRRANAALWSALVQDAIDEGTLRPEFGRFLIQLYIVNTVDTAMEWLWRVPDSPDAARALGQLLLEGVKT